MKRFISILMILCICSSSIFAFEEEDEYDDGYVYEQNGAGDQFLKISVLADFPLNFGQQVYPGAGVSLAYYRFISSKIALGGEATIDYNVTIGNKPLITVPVTFGILFQPYVGKFEFPLTAGIGFGSTSCQGLTYFPGLAAKVGGGVFYRFTEAWSFGVDGTAYVLPQWFKDTSKNDVGYFATAGINARYHF